MSQNQLEQDFRSDASYDRLPIRLVAFEAGELTGTILLRENGSGMPPEFQPGLGVSPDGRSSGRIAILVPLYAVKAPALC